jgi:tetrapyrrole methylase family protein / MazG family protein
MTLSTSSTDPSRLPTITVVGLGPGNPSLVTDQTKAAIATSSHRFLRTARHPSASLVPGATTFDEIYDSADRFIDVYETIVEKLADAATAHGDVLYAVPGSPLILERTVELLRQRSDIECLVLPAISFLDELWARLALDPVDAGVRLIDGHRFATEAAGERGPLLVAHVHADWVLSDIRHSIDAGPDDEAQSALDHSLVIGLSGIGTKDERIIETTWGEMEREISPDHLTSLYIPDLAVPVGHGYVRFHALARTLREQCPWDIEQTHTSLLPYLIEETYEVVDAINALNDDPQSDEHLIEELGDLLYQIEFHATIAEQQGRFTIADVTSAIHDKLVRRHPHVFGDVDASDAATVISNWENIKRDERSTSGEVRASVLDGVPQSLPSLSHAATVQRKAAKVGFDWPDTSGPLDKIAEETAETIEAHASGDEQEIRSEIGDLLFAVVNFARHLGVEPESALRGATDRFSDRFREVERLADEAGTSLKDLDLAGLDQLWNQAKRNLQS